MDDFYTLNILNLKRNLPKIKINENLTIASFVMLGDTELIETCAEEINKQIPYINYIVCPEAKSIPLAHAVASRRGINYIVLRKSVKGYMKKPIVREVKSITTIEKQELVIDGVDANKIKNKKVAILDDVVSTGGTIQEVEMLLQEVNANVVWKGCVLLEGDNEFENLFYIEKLPLW